MKKDPEYEDCPDKEIKGIESPEKLQMRFANLTRFLSLELLYSTENLQAPVNT